MPPKQPVTEVLLFCATEAPESKRNYYTLNPQTGLCNFANLQSHIDDPLCVPEQRTAAFANFICHSFYRGYLTRQLRHEFISMIRFPTQCLTGA